MLRFQTIDEMFYDAITRTLVGVPIGSRDGACREIVGYQAILSNPDQNFVLHPVRCLDPVYACAELLWYISGERDIERIVRYAPQYQRFANDGVAHGAYGWRWLADDSFLDTKIREKYEEPGSLSQLRCVIEQLKTKPASRQAVMTMWNAGDLLYGTYGKKNDLPCTLSLQLLLREGKLHMIATMRSNDVWLGLPYDIWSFTCVQRIIADCLGVAVGSYVHQAGSLHLYDRNADKATQVLNHKCEVPWVNNHGWNNMRSLVELTAAVHAEESVRLRKVDGLELVELVRGGRDMGADLAYVCAMKHCKLSIEGITSPILRRAWRNKYDNH